MKNLIFNRYILSILIFFSITAHVFASSKIIDYKIAEKKKTGFFKYEYQYKAVIKNSENFPTEFKAVIDKSSSSLSVIQPEIYFSKTEIGNTMESKNLFTLEGSLFLPFKLKSLGWRITALNKIEDKDEDTIPDSLDKCPDTLSGKEVNSCGCSPDEIIKNSFIDENGYRYFTLFPGTDHPLIIKTLEINAVEIEKGFSIKGSIFIKTSTGEFIEIRNTEIEALYDPEKSEKQLISLKGTSSFPAPDKNLFSFPESSSSLEVIHWLKNLNTSKAEISIGLGNQYSSSKLPILNNTYYISFALMGPLNNNQTPDNRFRVLLNPIDPSIFIKGELPILQGLIDDLFISFAGGLSAKGEILYSPFRMEDSDFKFTDYEDYFDNPDSGFDWFGDDFEGFTDEDGIEGFNANIYLEGGISLVDEPIDNADNFKISADGKIFIEPDPKKDGILPLNKKGKDKNIGCNGSLKIENFPIISHKIGNIDLTSKSSIMVKESDTEKSIYFYGDLSLNSETSKELVKAIPLDLSSSTSVQVSGLYDKYSMNRNFLRLKGDFGLNFKAGGMEKLGLTEGYNTSNLNTILLTSAEMRINNRGIWVQGKVNAGVSIEGLNISSDSKIELYIDTQNSLAVTRSYLKLYSKTDLYLNTPIFIKNLFPAVVKTKQRSTGLTLKSSTMGAVRLDRKGIALKGELSNDADIFSLKFKSGVFLKNLFIDLNPFDENGFSPSLEANGTFGLNLERTAIKLASKTTIYASPHKLWFDSETAVGMFGSGSKISALFTPSLIDITTNGRFFVQLDCISIGLIDLPGAENAWLNFNVNIRIEDSLNISWSGNSGFKGCLTNKEFDFPSVSGTIKLPELAIILQAGDLDPVYMGYLPKL